MAGWLHGALAASEQGPDPHGHHTAGTLGRMGKSPLLSGGLRQQGWTLAQRQNDLCHQQPRVLGVALGVKATARASDPGAACRDLWGLPAAHALPGADFPASVACYSLEATCPLTRAQEGWTG